MKLRNVGGNWIFFYFQDLKSEKHRAQMGVARAILEKSTMMLLTTSKVRVTVSFNEREEM